MKGPPARPAANGFTLIEMLVALAVFALIAGGAMLLLRFSVDAELSGKRTTERMAAERRFLSVWTADLAQAAPRPARDEAGIARPALETGGGVILRLVRSGWSNVDGTARPSLQKVEWRWDGKALVRAGYPFPDGAAPDPGSAMVALPAPPVLRFRTGDGVWHDRWEPQREAELPVAVELLLPRPQGEPMRVVSLVGVNYQ
jgi:general secretion pathway protein J